MRRVVLVITDPSSIDALVRAIGTLGIDWLAIPFCADRSAESVAEQLCQAWRASTFPVLKHPPLAREPLGAVSARVVGSEPMADDTAAMTPLLALALNRSTASEGGICRAVDPEERAPSSNENGLLPHDCEAHSAVRWARAVVPLVDASKDPRTIRQWSEAVFVSMGALRNWCRTAGVSPRRSLVLGRLLRAAVLNDGGRRRPEDLLDFVDRRTLHGILRFAGLDEQADFPTGGDNLLRRQQLVRDPVMLGQLRRAMTEHKQPSYSS
jgi:hypothetical protein